MQHEQIAELNLIKAETEDMLKIAEAKSKLQADHAFENKKGWDDLEVDSSIQTTLTRILLTDESPLTSPKASSTSTSTTTTSPTCAHQTQCVVRQPYAPPSPTWTFLHHEQSKYHEHMWKDDLLPFTHAHCMANDHRNYGCDNCVWWKWYGQLHGYPDIYPGDYKKYLDEKIDRLIQFGSHADLLIN